MRTGFVLLNLDLFFNTKSRLFQADLQIVPKIRATLSPASVTRSSARPKNLIKNPPAAFTAHSEHLAENIKRIMESSGTRPSRTSCAKCCMTKLVIRSAFILVYENLVGFSELLKPFFGSRVSGVLVRMILYRELAIDFLYFLRARITPYSQYLIVISFRCHSLCRGAGFCRVRTD